MDGIIIITHFNQLVDARAGARGGDRCEPAKRRCARS